VGEWFYLLTPFIIFILAGVFKVKPQKAILTFVIAVIAATIIVRYYRYLTIPVIGEEVWGAVFRVQVVTRLDSLMFGVAGAYFYNYHPLSRIKYKNKTFIIGLASVILIAIIPRLLFPASAFYFCNISFIINSLSILLVLPFLSSLQTGKGLIYKYFTYTSLISYSMYLTHASLIMIFLIPKITFLQSLQPAIIAAKFFLYWMLSYGISILLYKYFEIPFMAIRHKKFIFFNRKVTKNSF
jgi:hypothetical protein